MTMISEILKELMASEKTYNDFSPELVKARERAFVLARKYNESIGDLPERRNNILRELLRKIGDNVHFEWMFRCEFGFNISIGDNFYANADCILLDAGEITIGNNVLFGPRVGIYTANHSIHPQERIHGGCYAKPVKIENNVWIGGGTIINQGVNIGENTIIGSGSVVTKDIPANAIAAGIPCKVLREITEKDRTGYAGDLRYNKLV